MYFLRAIIATLLSLACTLAVSAFVTLQTINTTVLDRSEVKSWLAQSGTYDKLLSTLSVNLTENEQQSTLQNAEVFKKAFKDALVQTVPADFVKQSSERVIDSTYNWLDAKQPAIQFEIDATGYKEAFSQNLSAALEPRLAAMPVCRSLAQFDSTDPTCLPPGATAKQAADAIAIDMTNQAGIFNQPLSTEYITQLLQGSDMSLSGNSSQQLPHYITLMRQLVLWLPLIALACGALAVLLAQHRLKTAKQLAGHLTLGLAITSALGLLAAYVGQGLRFNNYADDTSAAIATNIVEPIARQVIPAVGFRLALVSGICGGITFVLWIVLHALYRRRQRAQLHQTASAPTDTTPQASSARPSDNPSEPNKPAGS